MKNGSLMVKLEEDSGVVYQDVAKSIKQLPGHLVSNIIG